MTPSNVLTIIALLASIESCSAKIMVFEKTNNKQTQNHKHDSHLPLSSLFSQSANYQCLNKNGGDCRENDQEEPFDASKTYIGPRYQKVHMALPRREQTKVGQTENITLNNREMTVTTLSTSPYIVEISNFLSENETDLIIDMATHKGLKEKKFRAPYVYFPNEIDQDIFDKWDKDFDGHLSDDEVFQILEMNPLLMSREEIRNMMNDSGIDTDRNGYMSYGELSNGGMLTMKNYLVNREVERAYMKGRGVKEAWLWHDEDELLSYEDLLEDYHERLEKISLVPAELLEQSEPLNVIKNEQGSFGSCQHDSKPISYEKKTTCCVFGGDNCQICRYATFLMFLNDVEKGGEILFPLADNSTFEWADLKEDTLRKCEKVPNKTASNLVIKPKRGSAIFYYNHVISSSTGWMSFMDPQSLLGSSTVDVGERWIAKMWINIIGDGVNELRPWKLGANWLSKPNENFDVIEKLRNDYFREAEPYYHHHRNTYKRDSARPVDNQFEESFNHNHNTVYTNQIKASSSLNHATNDIKRNVFEEKVVPVDVNSKELGIKSSTAKLPLKENSIEAHKNKASNSKQFVQSEKSLDSENEVKLSEPAYKKVKNEQKKLNNRGPIKPSLKNLDIPLTPMSAFKNKSLLVQKQTVTKKTPSTGDGVIKEPPKRSIDPKKSLPGKNDGESRLVKASLLLVDELDREELEIIARNLHDRLQLTCIPLIVNPI